MSRAPLKPLILVCQLRSNIEDVSGGEVCTTSNALSCLSEATQRNFSLVVIDLLVSMIQKRGEVIELCRCLRTHPLTKQMPVIVSLDAFQRDMAVKLNDIGLKFMDVRKIGGMIDPGHLLRLVHLDDPSIYINPILDNLCPFLHYSPIDEKCELTTCNACGNRMVLGGRRLHGVCETSDHEYCDYFLHSRVAS